MAFCLPKKEAEQFKEALRGGKIVPEKLSAMWSAERRAFFEEIVGSSARDVNALLESKLLLVDVKRGLVTWAKKVSGITEPARKDLISRIERLEKILDPEDMNAFLEDLASQKLGATVTLEQAQTVLKLAKEADELRSRIPDNAPRDSIERLEYGIKFVELQNYVRELKGEKVTFDDILHDPIEGVYITAGLTKSLLSSFDNSLFGRQAIKILYTNPSLWVKNFIKSFGDIAKEIGGKKGVMDAIKAEIYSRPNALNGKYEKAKIDIGISSEEAFPISLPGEIPGFGNLFKASETAFQGGALRMRADYADRLIARAEELGIDMNNPAEALHIGRVVNASTGRGHIGKLDVIGKEINAYVFSIKFLKANIDTLMGHGALKGAIADVRGAVGGPKPTYTRGQKFARQVAATNILKIMGTLATIYFTANLIKPGTVELDPRSSKFGKIRIGNGYFDPTGGMGSLVVLAARLTPTFREGKWSLWYKSATTGKWTDLLAGKYGQLNALDLIENFAEGKVSPVAAVVRDVLKGENFQGDKVTPFNAAYSVFTPLPIQSANQLGKVQPLDTPEGLAGVLLEALGFSSSTYQPKK